MASIHKTREGTYLVSFYVDGRRFRKRVGKNKSVAQKIATDIDYFIKTGDYKALENYLKRLIIKKRVVDFEDAKNAFLDNLKNKGLKPGSIASYRQLLTSFQGFLEDRGIHSLNGLDEDDFIEFAEFRSNLNQSENTLKRVKQSLIAFSEFIQLKYDFSLDIESIKIEILNLVKRAPKSSLNIKVIEKEEFDQILSQIRHERVKLALVIIYYTGMRRSEAWELKYENIDLEKEVFIIEEGKTENSSRIVPMHKELKTKLQEYFQQRDFEEGDYIFQNDEGKLGQSKIISREFLRAQRKLNWQDTYRVHDLRHSFASKLLEKTRDYKTVSELLGHKSITTTLDIYGHISTDHKRKLIEMLDEESEE